MVFIVCFVTVGFINHILDRKSSEIVFFFEMFEMFRILIFFTYSRARVQMARLEREETLGSLPLEIVAGANKARRARLADLRGFSRIVIVAGTRACALDPVKS